MTQNSQKSGPSNSVIKSTVSESVDQFESRKTQHIQYALDRRSQSQALDLDQMQLAHEALPELDFEEISLETDYWGRKASVPLFCSSMTAGNPKGQSLNRILAEACAIKGWAMGLGSQRRELFDTAASSEVKLLRQAHPNLILFANLGLAQVIQTPISDIQKIIDNMQAQALIVHLNPLQECLQPEGTPQFKGGFQALEVLSQKLPVPVIVKEVGCGFSLKTLKRLNQAGVAAVDLAGRGGTHWGRIEGMRAGAQDPENSQAKAAEVFKDWGFSTFESLRSLDKKSVSYQVWASGGVRSGLDAAKLIAMGASKVGTAKPLIEAAVVGLDRTVKALEQFEYELKIACFCVGASNIEKLGSTEWYLSASR